MRRTLSLEEWSRQEKDLNTFFLLEMSYRKEAKISTEQGTSLF